MAGKSKAPEYQAQIPSFLRKLREENTGGYASDGRQLNPVSIARSKRLEKDDSDDAPAYVLEEGGELTNDQAAKMLAGELDGTEANNRELAGSRQNPVMTSAAVGDATVGRKRKAAKIIGGDDVEGETGRVTRTSPSKDGRSAAGPKILSKSGTSTGLISKKRKKPAVTLSFCDDDAD